MSDNELDAELLGMVGGESDDEAEDLDMTQQVDDRSPSQEAKPSVEKTDEPPKRQKGVASKVRKSRARKRKQESEDEDDLDLGSPSPAPESLGSGAMDESDVEEDAPGSPDEDAPLYPLEGKYLNPRDRDDILALPEIRREELLAERAAEVLKRQQDLQLKRALAQTKAAASKHKRKATAADLDDGDARRTRPKADKAKTALDDYKRARELKGTDRGRLDTARDRRDERSPSSASDRDAEGESEVEWAEPSSDNRRDEPPAELKDFERCRIGRSNFARICFYPGFEESIKGCFCRVSIGLNRETGQNQYRMTQIKSFTEGKPYQMEAANGKHFTTDQYALVAHGSAEKPWPFSACSDSKFLPEEFDRFMSTLTKENLRVPSRKYLTGRLDDINNLLNMQWSEQQISAKIAKQRAMERKYDPANAARLKRENIAKRKLEAEEAGDADEVMKCDAELAALENGMASSSISTIHHNNGSLVKPTPLAKKPSATGGKNERLAQLNAKNRGKNTEEVRKALLEEKRKLQLAREQAAAEAKAKAEKKRREEEAKMLAVPRNDMSDLFGEGGASDISRTGTPVGGTPRRSRAGTPLNGVKKEKSGLAGVVGAIKKRNLDDDVIGSMDLGIDVEI